MPTLAFILGGGGGGGGGAGQTPVNGNAENADSEDILRKFLNPALRGAGWNALIAGLATGDAKNRENAQLAFDQLFISTASGFYLDRKAGDEGVERPPNLGMPDPLFRAYAIRTRASKLTQEVLNEVLEILYGVEAVRAFAVTTLYEPYALANGDDLRINIDGVEDFTVTFATTAFTNIGSASALEVAAAITDSIFNVGGEAFAIPFFDPTANANAIRIYTPSLGLSGSIRVTGGRAQNALKFNNPLPAYGLGILPTWNILFNTATSVLTYTVTGSTNLDLNQVVAGDYVNIYGTEFQPGNRGSFPVLSVNVSYPGGLLTQTFTVANPTGVAQVIAQTDESSMLFFRPTKRTIHAQGSRAVYVTQTPGVDIVVIPATSQAVGRGVDNASYYQPTAIIEATSVERTPDGIVTVVATGHGLKPGGQVIIDGERGSADHPSVTAGNPVSSPALSDYSVATIWSLGKTVPAGNQYLYHTLTTLADGLTALVVGGEHLGGIVHNSCALFHISATVPHGAAFQYQYDWTAAAPLITAREFHASIPLHDFALSGKVLVVGGLNNVGTALSSCELFTSGGIGSWAATTAIPTARAALALGEIKQAAGQTKVMASGGATSATAVTAAVHLFAPATQTWTATGSLIEARCQHQQTLLHDGRVLITGGRDLTGGHLKYSSSSDMGRILNTCEVWDPAAPTWVRTGRLTYVRFGHTTVLLADGRVLVIGGWGFDPTQSSTPVLLSSCEVWDPNTGLWLPIDPLPVAKDFPVAAVHPNGLKVYVFGGQDSSAFLLDLRKLTWETAPSGVSRELAQGAVLSDGVILQVGGLSAGSASGSTYLLQPNADRYMSGGLNGMFQVAVYDSNTFYYKTPSNLAYTNSQATATATRVAAPGAG